MKYKIESAQQTDIPQLVILLDELYGIELDFTADATRQARGLELLIRGASASDRQTVAVARDEAGLAVGMASAQLVISTAEGAASAWIEDVVVHADHRRRGVASALLNHLVAWAKARGATRAQLVADSENENAEKLYDALGWQTTQLIARRRFIE